MIIVLSRSAGDVIPFTSIDATSEKYRKEGFIWEHAILCTGRGGVSEIGAAQRVAESLGSDYLVRYDDVEEVGTTVWFSYSVDEIFECSKCEDTGRPLMSRGIKGEKE